MFIAVWLALIALIIAALIVFGDFSGGGESIKEVMRDGVLHEENKIAVLGLEVNPGLVSAYTVTLILLVFALILRIFAVPRLKRVPGKLQSVLEWTVGFFYDMADKNSPDRPRFVGAYIFGAGSYVFFGTLFELLGVQAVTTGGRSVSLPAPLSDINGAIAVGFTSFIVIFLAGLFTRGPKGALGEATFTLPDGQKRICSVSQGMIKVKDNTVRMMCESVLRPEEIDEEAELREAENAAEDMRGKQSYKEYTLSQLVFARAVNNLRVKKHDAAKLNQR